MAPYKLTIAYDGTEFLGFQRQKNGRTVQQEIENALQKIGWDGQSILSAGRTDTGVHADGQVIKIEMDWAHKPRELLNAMNATLPQDISVKAVRKCTGEFHPRFDAIGRKYRYQMVFLPARDPLLERYFWRVWPKPDMEKMNAAAELLKGTHDFHAFGSPPKADGTTVRTIQEAEWRTDGKKEACFSIVSKAFLYHMVRRIVFLLVRIGHGKLDAMELVKSFNHQGILPAGIAPPHGLFLEEVMY